MAVNHHDLSVVPVIEHHGNHRAEGIEHLALDAPGPYFLIKLGGKGVYASHVVVNQPHVQSGSGLYLQNIQDSAPHLSVVDDKVLQENEIFCLLQLLNHFLIQLLSHRKIFRPGIPVNRKARIIPQIDGLLVNLKVRLFQFPSSVFFFLQQVPAGPGGIGKTALHLPGHPGFSEKKVNAGSHHGNRQDQDGPGQLVGRIDPLVYQPQNRHDARRLLDHIKRLEPGSQQIHQPDKPDHLNKNGNCHKKQSAEQPF